MNQKPIKWQRFGKIARFGKVRVLAWKSNNPAGIMKFETRGFGPCAINQYLMNGKHFDSLEELMNEINPISPPPDFVDFQRITKQMHAIHPHPISATS